MSMKFLLMVNKQGQTRLAQYVLLGLLLLFHTSRSGCSSLYMAHFLTYADDCFAKLFVKTQSLWDFHIVTTVGKKILSTDDFFFRPCFSSIDVRTGTTNT